jgi:hypothetical protein
VILSQGSIVGGRLFGCHIPPPVSTQNKQMSQETPSR